jgi:hypothetical protein
MVEALQEAAHHRLARLLEPIAGFQTQPAMCTREMQVAEGLRTAERELLEELLGSLQSWNIDK